MSRLDETITVDAPRRSATTPQVVLLHRHGLARRLLHEGQPICVGRAAPADWVVDEGSLSRRHATLRVEGGIVRLRDEGSKNGSWLNGERIDTEVIVGAGDHVRLGEVALLVRSGGAQPLLDHDSFLAALERELARARFADRSAALLLLEGDAAPGAWLSALLSSEHDATVGSYAPQTLEVLLAGASAAAAQQICAQLTGLTRAGVAVFPQHGDGAAGLLAAAADAFHRAGGAHPVAVASVSSDADDGAVVVSAAMRELHDTARRAARSSLPVLIRGETGVGKEVLARVVHEASPRRGAPFVALNCGALPPSLLQSQLFGHERGAFTGADSRHEGAARRADGGTLFLDEVGELTQEAQVALLRVLAEGEILPLGASASQRVDLRVIAATHADLEALSQRGDFRLDLYYRLAVVTLAVPPLRERVDEIEPLVTRFLEAARARHGTRVTRVAPEVLARLQSYGWPGNVRELRNVLERAAVLASSDRLELDDLPTTLRGAGAGPGDAEQQAASFRQRLQRVEAELITEALRACDYNQSEAARRLHMPLRTMVRKIKSYGLGR
jgi:DNA-binding NtrC family response regulator